MKNGQNSGSCYADEITQQELVAMLGGEGSKKEKKAAQGNVSASADTAVEIHDYTGKGLYNINMQVNRGEIVGISGLAGSGQTALLNLIFEARKRLGQEKNGVRVNATTSYVSGDRAKEGVFHLWDIADNTLIANLDQVKSGIALDKKKEEKLAQTWYDKLKFKAEGIHSPIMSLSGGNQQKALIARGIASGSELIILNDPTAGVDIETKQEIYALLDEAKQAGKAVILYSTEDSEIEICDRAYIMHEGEITEELAGEDITVSNIIKASFKDVRHDTSVKEEKQSFLHRVFSSRLLLPVVTMLVMIALNTMKNPRVLSYMGMRMLVSSAVPLIFAALGQMFIVVAGDIDMGNGYSIGLVNVLVAIVLTGNVWIGIGSLIIFILCYMGMGALVHLRNIPSIVVTLGAQFIWYGIALIIAPSPGGSCPEWLSTIYKSNFPLIPMPIVWCILAALFCWFVLYRAKYGMVLRGIGNNPLAVERSGWSYLLAKLTDYALSGLMVVLAGMTYTAVCMGGDANSSSSYCMMSIATVILGGCEMSGGIVEPVGVVCAGIAMSFITTLLTSFRVDSNYQTAVTGLILIAVLAIKLITHRKEAK
jgi:ribose transport system ATP-binding protein